MTGELGGSTLPRGSDVLAVEPHPGSVLTAVVTVRPGWRARVGVSARADGHEVSVPVTAAARPEHRVPLVGLRPSTEYMIRAQALDHAGQPADVGAPARFATGALPADFPRIRVRSDPARMAPGLTLFNLMPCLLPRPGAAGRPVGERRGIPMDLADRSMLGYLIAVDPDGYVVWYYRAGLGIEDARQLPNGDLLISYDDCMARQIDMLGNTVREWAARAARWHPLDDLGRPRTGPGAIPVDADTIHHEVGLSPSGNLLFLSTELRTVRGQVHGEPDGCYEVVGDVVVEADPATGAALGQWRLLDIIDPIGRPGIHLLDGGLRAAFPAVFYRQAGFPRDWSHANAAVVDLKRNALVLSLRHLDCIVALRYRADNFGPAGELLWELSPRGAVLLGGGDWPSYQHAIEVQPDGDILLYDNGVGRWDLAPPERREQPWSRAVLFGVEKPPGGPLRVRQLWEHRLPHDGGLAFCRRLGDADRLPNGNMLITHGNLADAAGMISARIIEVIPAGKCGGETVFDLTVDDDRCGWSVYRAARIESFYQ